MSEDKPSEARKRYSEERNLQERLRSSSHQIAHTQHTHTNIETPSAIRQDQMMLQHQTLNGDSRHYQDARGAPLIGVQMMNTPVNGFGLGSHDQIQPNPPLAPYYFQQEPPLTYLRHNTASNIFMDTLPHQNASQNLSRQLPLIRNDQFIMPAAHDSIPLTMAVPVTYDSFPLATRMGLVSHPSNPLSYHMSGRDVESDLNATLSIDANLQRTRNDRFTMPGANDSFLSTIPVTYNSLPSTTRMGLISHPSDALTYLASGVNAESDLNASQSTDANLQSFQMNQSHARSVADPSVNHSAHEHLDHTASAMETGSQTTPAEAPTKKSRAPKRRPSKTFDEHFVDLVAFKERYGHCNVPHRFKENPSLGNWCNNIRTSWRIMKDGGTPSSYKLTKDQIKRLDKIGFRWKVYSNRSQFRINTEHKT